MFRRAFLFSVFILLIAAIPAAAAQVKARDFSATLVILEKGNTLNGRFHYTKDKQRLEMTSPDSGDKSIIITRLDKDLAWMVMPSQRMYMEMPIAQQKPNPLAEDSDKIIKREKLGKDTVDGHPCLKEKVTVKQDDGSKESMYWWLATDIGWPIQAEAIDGSWRYTYKDIKFGKQDRKLFEVPAGYHRMNAPRYGAPEPPDYPEPPDMAEPPSYPEPPDAPEPPIPSIPSPPTPW